MQLECIMSLKFLTSDSFYVGSVKSLKPVMYDSCFYSMINRTSRF